MAMIELVDFNEIYNAGKPKKQKTTRRGRSKKADDATAVVEETAKAEEPKVEEPKAEKKADDAQE